MYKIGLIILISLFVYSCSTNNDTPSTSRLDLQQHIDSLKKEILISGVTPNNEINGKRIVIVYKDYANAFPDDTLSKKYLFECSQVYVGLGLAPEAMDVLDTLVARYPNTELAPSALQFKAFILDEKMRRWQKAAETLDILIEKYPNSDIIENAKAYKETLGKSPEQVIKEMEARDNNAK